LKECLGLLTDREIRLIKVLHRQGLQKVRVLEQSADLQPGDIHLIPVLIRTGLVYLTGASQYSGRSAVVALTGFGKLAAEAVAAGEVVGLPDRQLAGIWAAPARRPASRASGYAGLPEAVTA
jgi:hypothetical protein